MTTKVAGDIIYATSAALAGIAGINSRRNTTTNDNVATDQPNQTDQNKRPRLAAGGPVGSKFQKSEGKIKLRKKKMTKLQLLLLKDTMTTDYVIGRYQRLTPSLYDHNSLVQASYRLNKQFSAADKVMMPLYAFNLTMSPTVSGYDTSRFGYTCPFYRLNKYISASGALDSAVDNYSWLIQSGQLSDGTTLVQTYDIEKAASYRDENFYIHEWSDVGISIANNGNKSHRIHIALAKFRNPAAEPNRYWYNLSGALTTKDTIYPKEVYNAADLAWDKFWSTRTIHPLRTIEPMRDSKIFDFLTYDCICMEPLGTTRTGMPIHTWKRFIDNGQLFNTRSFTNAEAAHKPNINTQTTACNYNQDIDTIVDTNLNIDPCGKKGCDTYLLIWADSYGDIDPLNDNLERAIPSFDIKVRTKVSFSHQ